MLINDLTRIVQTERARGTRQVYMVSQLKEYFQAYVLNYIYTRSGREKSLIFTGGTCLRHCYGLSRLSEDLDFNVVGKFESGRLAEGLSEYFKRELLFSGVRVSVKQKGKQILLKFPVMRELGLADESASNWLHIKLDISAQESEHYGTIKSLQNKQGLNYLVTHYDLPSLMPGKIRAVLERARREGREDRLVVKGRDYFDLLWFLKREVEPNRARLADLLNEKVTLKQLVGRLDKKVDWVTGEMKTEFRRDLLPFISDDRVVAGYVDGYQKSYQEAKKYLEGMK